MAIEQERAALSIARGKQAARISDQGEKKQYIADTASIDKDYSQVKEATAVKENELKGRAVMGSFKKGGVVKKTGVYKVHKGERVISHGVNKVKMNASSSANHRRYSFGKE